MIFLNLDGLNKVEQLVKVCDKYEIDSKEYEVNLRF